LIPKKYSKEIIKWRNSEEAKNKTGGCGYPKTPISQSQYVMFREEGETPKILFGSHYVLGKVSKK